MDAASCFANSHYILKFQRFFGWMLRRYCTEKRK